MNAGLRYLPSHRRLSPRLAEDLQQYDAALRSSLQAEHGPEGAHTDVTATTITTSGVAAFAQERFNGRAVVTLSTLAVANYIQRPMEGVSRLILPSSGASAGTIHGLSTVGRVDGDRVWLENHDGQSTGGGFSIRLQATGTAPADCAKFHGEPGAPNTDIAISQNRGVWAVLSTYDFEQGGTKRWIVQQF